MSELPLAPVSHILKNAGATRTTDETKITLAEVLEKKADEISRQAILLTRHAGRKNC